MAKKPLPQATEAAVHEVWNQLHPAFRRCQALQDAKADDYSGGEGQDFARTDYHPYGDVSYLQMLHTKFQRIEAMVKKRQNGREIKFEGLKDSVEDLINYASFFWAHLDNEEKTDGSPD